MQAIKKNNDADFQPINSKFALWKFKLHTTFKENELEKNEPTNLPFYIHSQITNSLSNPNG